LTEAGYLKRMPVNEFESTSRGSRGKAGTKTQEDDEVKLFISCNDHDTLCFSVIEAYLMLCQHIESP